MQYFLYFWLFLIALLALRYVITLSLAKAAGVSPGMLFVVEVFVNFLRYLIIFALMTAAMLTLTRFQAGEALLFFGAMAALGVSFFIAAAAVGWLSGRPFMAPVRAASQRITDETLRRRGYVRPPSE